MRLMKARGAILADFVRKQTTQIPLSFKEGKAFLTKHYAEQQKGPDAAERIAAAEKLLANVHSDLLASLDNNLLDYVSQLLVGRTAH